MPSDILDPAVPGLIEQETCRDEFAKLVSYRFYRLRNRRQKLTAKVSREVNAQLKRLKHHINGQFSGD
jgi:hypothetical protein